MTMRQSSKSHRKAEHRKGDRDPEAFKEGRDAARLGCLVNANPYFRGTTEHREWSRGHRTASKAQL
jgi:hypothetical protein